MANIDKLTDNKVFEDPVKKVQQEMLRDLLAIRKNFAEGIDHALSNGGSGAGGATVSKEDYDKLEAENRKLKYRITHLLRALDETDGGAPGGGTSAMPAMKMFVQEGVASGHTNMVSVVAALLGAHIDVEVIDEETRTSKAHAKINPTGRLPLL